jgi:transcriptional regulator with XRE-family HTH domain
MGERIAAARARLHAYLETKTMIEDTTPMPCLGLAAHREARGLTQPQLARLVRKSRRQVQRYEREGQAPAALLDALAERWGLALQALTAEPVAGPDRELVRLARSHERALARLVKAHGRKAMEAARARVTAASPQVARWIGE